MVGEWGSKSGWWDASVYLEGLSGLGNGPNCGPECLVA